MRVSDLERLFDYHYWANKKLLDVVGQLTPDEFGQSVAGSYGSVRNTLVHVMSAEWGWLDRCGGPPRGPRLKPEDYPSFESLVDTWVKVEGYMRGFLASLDDVELAREIEFAFGNSPTASASVGDLLQHAAIHAVHHRGQVALLLRLLGRVPGDFDMLYYASQRRVAS